MRARYTHKNTVLGHGMDNKNQEFFFDIILAMCYYRFTVSERLLNSRLIFE